MDASPMLTRIRLSGPPTHTTPPPPRGGGPPPLAARDPPAGAPHAPPSHVVAGGAAPRPNLGVGVGRGGRDVGVARAGGAGNLLPAAPPPLRDQRVDLLG